MKFDHSKNPSMNDRFFEEKSSAQLLDEVIREKEKDSIGNTGKKKENTDNSEPYDYELVGRIIDKFLFLMFVFFAAITFFWIYGFRIAHYFGFVVYLTVLVVTGIGMSISLKLFRTSPAYASFLVFFEGLAFGFFSFALEASLYYDATLKDYALEPYFKHGLFVCVFGILIGVSLVFRLLHEFYILDLKEFSFSYFVTMIGGIAISAAICYIVYATGLGALRFTKNFFPLTLLVCAAWAFTHSLFYHILQGEKLIHANTEKELSPGIEWNVALRCVISIPFVLMIIINLLKEGFFFTLFK